MKKIVLIPVMAAIVLSIAATVFAATTNVNVSANIVGTCQFDTTPGLAFGALDQTSSADATAAGNLTFWCTNGTAYTLSDPVNPGVGDGSFAGQLSDGTNTIDYTITYTNPVGTGSGKTTLKTSALTATILNANYVNKPASSYNGTVTFTIAP